MVLAFACALTATVCYGVGTVLQAAGARRVTSAAHLDVMLLARLARQSSYIGGLALDAVGFVAAIVALHTLPLFVVQAAIAGSLGVTAAAASVVFGFRLRRSDRVAIAALLFGLALLGVSAESEPAAHLSRVGAWSLLGGVVLVVGAGVAAARRHDRHAGIALAFCAGLGFAGTAIAARALFIPTPAWHLAGEPVAIALVGYGVCGVLMFASALQRGAVTATTAVMLGVETVVPAVVGLGTLGDRTRPHLALVAVAGFVLAVGASLTLGRYTEPAIPAGDTDDTGDAGDAGGQDGPVPERSEHWEHIYASTPSTEVSWFAREPVVSLRLIEAHAPNRSAPVIDVGAGASLLVDRLLDAGFTDVSVLDVSHHALGEVQQRLGERAASVTFVEQDVLAWAPDRRYAIWHDRAVFHFLTERADRDRYVEIAANAIPAGGSLVLGTFADDGPTHCSGLAVSRYSAADLEAVFSPQFTLAGHEREEHITPWDAVQHFTWAVLRRA